MDDDFSNLVSHLRITLVFYHHKVKHKNKTNLTLNKIFSTNSFASAYWTIILPDLKCGSYFWFAWPPPSPNPFLVAKFYCSSEETYILSVASFPFFTVVCLISLPPHFLDNSHSFPTSPASLVSSPSSQSWVPLTIF